MGLVPTDKYYINQPIQLYRDLSVILGINHSECEHLINIIAKVIASRCNRYYNKDKGSRSVQIPHIGNIYFTCNGTELENVSIKLDKSFAEGIVKAMDGNSILLSDAEEKLVSIFKDKYNSIL